LKGLLFILAFLVFSTLAYGQVPVNDSIQNAINLPIISNYCTSDAAYSNLNATSSNLGLPEGWGSQGKDVWFKFTATRTDVNITITGASTGGGSTGGTLQNPLIALYTIGATGQGTTGIVGSLLKDAGVSSFYKGGLTIGQTYYIRISAENNNTGTFRLCYNNYSPPLLPGQDCSSASFLCSKQTFTQSNVVGAGSNSHESIGTCLMGDESNTAWYKWQAATSGTLTFVITPTVNTDDIDFVLYDLGTTNSCDLSNPLRCAAGHGVDNTGCPNEPLYFKTGLSMTETDISEASGCGQGQNGFVKYIDMVQGHYYALLINNFTSGNNGFTLTFDGTGDFVGPKAAFTVTGGVPCTAGQIFTFTNQSTNYGQSQWSFGEDATPSTATGAGPFTVTYSTPGIKTAVLDASSGNGCDVVADTTFTVGIKPPKPPITKLSTQYCLLDTLTLSTPVKTNYTYQWTGPNNFSSTLPTVKVPITAYNMAGNYVLTVTQFGCTSDTAEVVLVNIGHKPVDDFTITANNLCTPQQSFTITNNSSDYVSLQWDYGTGANTPTTLSGNSVNLTYNTYGEKTITITAIGNTGCVTTLSKTVMVPMKPALPVINAGTGKVCVGDSLTLSTPVQANTTYLWSRPNGFTATTPVVKILATGPGIAGTYSLTVTQGLCTSDVATTVIDAADIISIPVASFTAIPAIPASLTVPTSVLFTNTSTLADSYLWNFGDGSTSTDVNPVHTYTTKGDFTVTLTATSQGLCNNTVAKGKLIVRYNVVIFIPNTFTPNGDGINDVFNVKITNTKTYHIQIFNRFGAKLYDGYDTGNPWQGIYNGQNVPVGTYYYVIDALTLNDDKLKESGPVTIIR
jgi:gliding motility-associated-like protein